MVSKNRWAKKLALLLFWPLGLVLSRATASISSQVENYYTLGFSKPVSKNLSLITGILPFSLAEMLVWLLVLVLILGLVRVFIFKIRDIKAKKQIGYGLGESRKKTRGFLAYFYKTLVFLGIIYFSFMVLWGLNYNRLSFAEIASLSVQQSSVEELHDLCAKLIHRANELRLGLAEAEDERGVLRIEGKFQTVRSLAPAALSKAALIYPELKGEFGRPKPVFFSHLMSYTGISGIYFPFTAEANVNIDIPDCMLPATTCHEMAHQRGFAREDEANYIAWIACSSSDEAVFQYSGTLLALIYAMNALHANAPELAGGLQDEYSEGVRRDLRDIAEYWEQFEGKVEEAASDINDAYLKSNRQEEGVQSYGRMVDLLLAEQKADGLKRMLP